ncbi:uncharacterized protein [Nicotiana sylvestris]|uniref:uncharacterized protein n=1 Tax=Nicotiana sylvestris TaxID=4096 RepID=UPI00388C429F
METSKKSWVALESKYKTENAGLKRFIATKFLDYKIVDSKSVITQVQELQVIIYDLLAEDISRINTDIESTKFIIFTNRIVIKGLVINETFQVAAMIEKLPPLWKDFKNYLKHKCKEMSLEDLIVRLRIEDDNKAVEKKGCGNSTIMGANIAEDASQNNRKRKTTSGPKNNPSKKRFNGNCYNCGKAGQRFVDCRAPKKDKKKVEKHEDVDDLCAMLYECNLVGNPKEWWIDSGATRHVCAVREAFATYAPIGPKETLSMGNAATAKIEG